MSSSSSIQSSTSIKSSIPEPESFSDGESIKSALIRLQVETSSEASFDSQASQYEQEAKNKTKSQHTSLDTFSLLYDQPNEHRYSNTLHLQSPPKSHNIEPSIASTTSSVIHHTFQSENNLINPIPQRFSQFIFDQSNHPLDGISVDSPKSSDYNANPTTFYKRHTRDISDSMGSQATIFSIKNQQLLDPNLVPFTLEPPRQMTCSSIRQKRRAFFKRTRTQKQRTSNVRLYRADSISNSSLHRQNAIKFKSGSLAYRLKCKLKKFLVKLKFFSFKVSSKRSKSVKKSNKFKKLIGNPSSNPHLGKTPVFKVAKSDTNVLQQKPQQQQPEQSQPITVPVQQEEHIPTEPVQPIPKSLNPAELAQDTAEARPPTPPPHTDNSYLENSNIYEDTNQIPELWKNYLLQVLITRIKLQQEITMFQKFVVDNEKNQQISFETESKLVDDLASTSSYSSVESDTRPQEQEFDKVLHRRSMLGEMLEYSSDEDDEREDDLQSSYSTASTAKFSKTYSIRRKPTITRSFGISHSLNDLSIAI
ncbi:hypothetical protein JA1_002512 [Spathaspora sp. JA1]|nr:hypothetical protein JA1_002512 [Spathaspora sp. JA1]